MHLFHKKSAPLRPLPASIPIQGTNYQELRDAILKITPLIDEQQTHINRGTGILAFMRENQRQIHHQLLYNIAPEAIGADESWLKEFNDVRCAMELKGITLKRLRKEDPERVDHEFEREHWKTYLENYTYLQYLLNRLLKELADYEHGKWWWIENGLPILEPPLPAGAAAAAAAASKNNNAATAADPEKAERAEKAEEQKAYSHKDKHVGFEKRVQGWYYNEDDIPLMTGRGEDKQARKEAEFHDKVVDGKSTAGAMILQSYKKKGGYLRCTEGFAKPVVQRRLPDEYRLARLKKLWPLEDLL